MRAPLNSSQTQLVLRTATGAQYLANATRAPGLLRRILTSHSFLNPLKRTNGPHVSKNPTPPRSTRAATKATKTNTKKNNNFSTDFAPLSAPKKKRPIKIRRKFRTKLPTPRKSYSEKHTFCLRVRGGEKEDTEKERKGQREGKREGGREERKEGRREGREEETKERRKEGRKEGRKKGMRKRERAVGGGKEKNGGGREMGKAKHSSISPQSPPRKNNKEKRRPAYKAEHRVLSKYNFCFPFFLV